MTMEANIQFTFLELEDAQIDVNKKNPASYVRKSFIQEKPVKKATLYMTALGVYKAYMNGQGLGKQLLRPGFTDYNKRVQYQTYDVTDMIRIGENVVGAIVGDGWYRGDLGVGSKRNFYGTRIQLAAVLEIADLEGTRYICTDTTWKESQDGALRENDLKNIELVDFTKELTGWNQAGFDDSAWRNCRLGSYGGMVVAEEGAQVLEQEHFKPVVLTTPNGEKILDFGQNHAGHILVRVTGEKGRKVSLIMGEVLDENGNFTLKNIAAERKDFLGGAVAQELSMILPGRTVEYKSLFLISGYRYAKPVNWPEEICPENFESIAIYADVEENGSFECSDRNINQLYHNVKWSMRSNFVEIPTDCPTRERAGWTGDINVFAETACYYADVRKFLKKWMRDFQLLQKKSGSSPYIVPEYPLPTIPDNCAGWTDALVNVPLVLYQFYGDREILQDMYPYAKRFVDYRIKLAKKKHLFHFWKLGKHYCHILDSGFHFGEWLEPGHDMVKDLYRNAIISDAETATAWHYHSLKQLAEMAGILGYGQDQVRYAEEAQAVKKAYQKEFLKTGTVDSERQCRYVRPVSMGLAEDHQAPEIIRKLNAMCVQNNYKIGTGFLTTYKILPTLCDYGYTETAYRMLQNKECPGWMYQIEKGATTVWENWLGIDENGVPVNSHNHYAPGAVAAWLFKYCAGLRPIEPGFRKVLIQPVPGGNLTYVKAHYKSVCGDFDVAWTIRDESFTLQFAAPETVDVTVKLPDGTTIAHARSGEYQCKYCT